MVIKETAMSWLKRGIATIPIMYKSKRPFFQRLKETNDVNNGRPTWDRMKTELPTEQDFEVWYKTVSNIAVVVGWQNLVIVDFDKLSAYEFWMQVYGTQGWADTYTVYTGRGYHLYYYIEQVPKHTLKWYGGEIKASGYCLIPPSIHPTHTPYKVANQEVPIMHLESIHDILPQDIFKNHEVKLPCIPPPRSLDDDIWMPKTELPYTHINQNVSILKFFPDIVGCDGLRWHTVYCPFHDDGATHGRPSGWVDTYKNRFGCHACVTGSLSVIDFYMRLKNVDAETAVRELGNAFT